MWIILVNSHFVQNQLHCTFGSYFLSFVQNQTMCFLHLEIFDINNQLMNKCGGRFHLPAFTLIRQPATENKYHYFWELTKGCEIRSSHIMFKKGNSRSWDPLLIAWSVVDFMKTSGIYFVPKMRSLVQVDQGIPKVETDYKQAFSVHRHPRLKRGPLWPSHDLCKMFSLSGTNQCCLVIFQRKNPWVRPWTQAWSAILRKSKN